MSKFLVRLSLLTAILMNACIILVSCDGDDSDSTSPLSTLAVMTGQMEDIYEDNDTLATASLLDVGGTYSAYLYPSDNDYYRFSVEPTNAPVVQVDPLQSGVSLGVDLFKVENDGGVESFVGVSRSRGGDGISEVWSLPSATGEFIAHVFALDTGVHGGNASFDYNIAIGEIENSPVGAPSVSFPTSISVAEGEWHSETLAVSGISPGDEVRIDTTLLTALYDIDNENLTFDVCATDIENESSFDFGLRVTNHGVSRALGSFGNSTWSSVSLVVGDDVQRSLALSIEHLVGRSGMPVMAYLDEMKNEETSEILTVDQWSVPSIRDTHGVQTLTYADIDGDQLNDLVWVDLFDSSVNWSLRNGTSFIGSDAGRVRVESVQWIVAGDFNGDGITDIAALQGHDGTIQLLPGSSEGLSSTPIELVEGSGHLSRRMFSLPIDEGGTSPVDFLVTRDSSPVVDIYIAAAGYEAHEFDTLGATPIAAMKLETSFGLGNSSLLFCGSPNEVYALNYTAGNVVSSNVTSSVTGYGSVSPAFEVTSLPESSGVNSGFMLWCEDRGARKVEFELFRADGLGGVSNVAGPVEPAYNPTWATFADENADGSFDFIYSSRYDGDLGFRWQAYHSVAAPGGSIDMSTESGADFYEFVEEVVNREDGSMTSTFFLVSGHDAAASFENEEKTGVSEAEVLKPDVGTDAAQRLYGKVLKAACFIKEFLAKQKARGKNTKVRNTKDCDLLKVAEKLKEYVTGCKVVAAKDDGVGGRQAWIPHVGCFIYLDKEDFDCSSAGDNWGGDWDDKRWTNLISTLLHEAIHKCCKTPSEQDASAGEVQFWECVEKEMERAVPAGEINDVDAASDAAQISSVGEPAKRPSAVAAGFKTAYSVEKLAALNYGITDAMYRDANEGRGIAMEVVKLCAACKDGEGPAGAKKDFQLSDAIGERVQDVVDSLGLDFLELKKAKKWFCARIKYEESDEVDPQTQKKIWKATNCDKIPVLVKMELSYCWKGCGWDTTKDAKSKEGFLYTDQFIGLIVNGVQDKECTDAEKRIVGPPSGATAEDIAAKSFTANAKVKKKGYDKTEADPLCIQLNLKKTKP